MDSTLLERVREFVAKETGTRIERLQLTTTLFGDLCINGADADDLLMDFGAAFSVDMKDCRFQRYFGPEGLPPSFLFSWLLFAVRRCSPERRRSSLFRGPRPVRIVKFKVMAQLRLSTILHRHPRDDLEYTPTAGLEAKLARPVVYLSDWGGKGRMQNPFHIVNQI
jgi:hypothetical protein